MYPQAVPALLNRAGPTDLARVGTGEREVLDCDSDPVFGPYRTGSIRPVDQNSAPAHPRCIRRRGDGNVAGEPKPIGALGRGIGHAPAGDNHRFARHALRLLASNEEALGGSRLPWPSIEPGISGIEERICDGSPRCHQGALQLPARAQDAGLHPVARTLKRKSALAGAGDSTNRSRVRVCKRRKPRERTVVPIEGVQGERDLADDTPLHRACEFPARDRQQPVVHLHVRAGTGCEPVRIGIGIRALQIGRDETLRVRLGRIPVPLPRLAPVHGEAGRNDHRHDVTHTSHAELPGHIAVERHGVSRVMHVGDGVPQPFARPVAQFLHPEAAKREPAPPSRTGNVATAAKVDVEHQPAVVVEIRAGQFAGTVRVGHRVVDEHFLGLREREPSALRFTPVGRDPDIESGEGNSTAEQQHGGKHREQHGAALLPPSGRRTCAPETPSIYQHGGSVDLRRALVCRPPARSRGEAG